MNENPYQSLPDDGSLPAPVPGVRPTSVTVFGVLNLVFAALGLCGGVMSGVVLFGDVLPQNPNMPNPTLELMEQSPGYRMYLMISLALAVVAAIVLAVGGIGLLKWKRYGRSASMIYGWFAIVSAIVGMVINYFFLIAPMLEQAQQLQGQEQATAMGGAIGGAVGGIAGVCGGMVYPAILLIFMYRRNVIDSLE